MPCSGREHALFRLENAPYRSRTTDAATELILQDPSESALIRGLHGSRTAPVALEALSAMQTESDDVFEAVRHAIGSDLGQSWALFDSLHRLPWYGGIRAFLSLPDPPQSSPCAYAFYILARNKIFIPPHLSGDPFDRCFHAMWRLVSAAKTGDWSHPDDGILTVLEMIETHLNRPEPDEFIVYFAALALGQIGSVDVVTKNLKNHKRGHSHPAVRRVAALALRHLRDALPPELQGDSTDYQRPTSGILSRLAAVPATMALPVIGAVLGLFRNTARE